MTEISDRAPRAIAVRRLVMGAIGVLAGLSTYLLSDILPGQVTSDRMLLFLGVWGAIGFGGTLLMAGPIRPALAALWSVPWGGVVAGLALWASHRFDTIEAFFEAGYPIAAILACGALPLPFRVAAGRRAAGWLDYEVLFDEAWRSLGRGLIAAVFTGGVWLVVWLCDALLGVVGIDWIGDLIDIVVVPYLVTGLVFGLGLAVIHEFAATLSPHVPLRLLRLLLPVVTAVTALFLAALPFRGLSGLFGALSPAATLIAMGAIGVALVAIAVDRRDAYAVQGGLLRLSARLMSVFVPCLGALGLWALAIRVGEYGLTPPRLAAATAAGMVLAYGLVYAFLAAPAVGDWMARLRRANVWLALAVLAVALAWLTPAINPERLSAQNQLARFERGQVSVEALDLRALDGAMGRPGRDVIARLSGLAHPQADRLAERISTLDQFPQTTLAAPGNLTPSARRDLVGRIVSRAEVRPTGTELSPAAFDAVAPYLLRQWASGCEGTTPAGNPGCLAYVGDLLPDVGGAEVLFFVTVPGERVETVLLSGSDAGPGTLAGDLGSFATAAALDALMSGEGALEDSQVTTLSLGGKTIFVLP